jgi:hypothetical protein
MAVALAMTLGRRRRLLFADFQVGEPEEHDLRFVAELHFDQRILARLRGDDRVDDAHSADATPMDVGEMRRLDAGLSHDDALADEY